MSRTFLKIRTTDYASSETSTIYKIIKTEMKLYGQRPNKQILTTKHPTKSADRRWLMNHYNNTSKNKTITLNLREGGDVTCRARAEQLNQNKRALTLTNN